jgi:HD-GYP domain-containing protein (c-di-GMP phosphodiesterase class II)
VAEAMALSMRQPILSIWKESFAWLWLYYLAFGVGAYALILGYQFAGVVGALAVMIPLITLRLSQVQFIEQTKKLVTQLKTQNVELENYAQEISTLYENLLHSLSGVIDLRDTYTHGHSDTVSELSVLIGKQLGLSAAQLEPLRMAGILHDIGKIGIPDAILFKPGPLTKEEYELVKQHPVRGADIVIKNKSLARVAPFIRYHHERIDGRGYPDGLSGEYIPLEARLLCVADAVEAMSSDRPYRKAMSLARILQELDDNAGTQFDRQVVTAFNQVVADQGKTTSSNLAKLFPTSAIPNKARAETS